MKTNSPIKATIIICTYNDAKYLISCIQSIINQSYRHFELLIIDDGSTDDTEKVVKSFTDSRIRYSKLEVNQGSRAKVRNYAINKAQFKYIFFTDSDCIVTKDWLLTGLNAFYNENPVAIEGKVIYVNDNYTPTLSDKTVENLSGGQWKTANMAFRKDIIKKFRFNENFDRLEDRELALRLQEQYKIPFIKSFKVYHQKKIRTITEYLKEASGVIYKVELLKYHNKDINKFRILAPASFLLLFFPPLAFIEFFRGKIKNFDDLKLIPFMWVKSVCIRYYIWKTALKKGVFVL